VVVVDVGALEGQAGFTPVRPDPLAMLVDLEFAQDEVVFVQAGALLHCPARADMIAALFVGDAPCYPVMTGARALDLIAAMTIGPDAA